MAHFLMITIVSGVTGVAVCLVGAYAVLVFGPDIDASHFGF